MQVQTLLKSNFARFAIAFGIVGICTIICLPLRDKVAASSLPMIYIIGVVIAASKLGIWPSIFSSILSVIAFNYYFTQPYHSLDFYDNSYYFTFGVMLITSLLVGSMTAQMSKLLDISRKEEKETHILYDFALGLSTQNNPQKMMEFARDFIGNFFDAQIIFHLKNKKNTTEKLILLAINSNEAIGNSCKIEGNNPSLYVSAKIDNNDFVILQTIPNFKNNKFTRSQIILQQTFVSLLSSALKSAKATEDAARNKIESENEKLRNVLLSSLSHDLRTPLTIMNGKISNLLKYRKSLPREGVNELTSLWHQLQKLQNFVANLLRMASISSGNLKLNTEYYTIAEIIGAAILRIEDTKGNRKILNSIDGQIPLVNVDGALIEQVVLNLLDNAISHTNDDGIIKIELSHNSKNIVVCIKDDGNGIEDGQEKLIFERFKTTSSNHDSQKGGTGLGLAICKGIIEAHGGTIIAKSNRPQKGASFEFTLPLPKVKNE